MSTKSFVDIVHITVKSGDGGNGAVSFRREKYVPKGGPDGGNGGRGGDVIFQGAPYLHSLSSLTVKRHYAAEHGLPGSKANKHGRDGKDVVLSVPCGTIIKDTQGQVIASITQEHERIVLLKGGKGGKGNVHFKNSVRQAPRFAQKGKAGESMALICELEIIAHVGLIGMPNAGKSTMLQALTQAHPKIDSYPFTTLHPNLGVLRNYEKELIVADIPGLIEGASHGEGLGLMFLKHCKKTKLLVFVLDSSTVASNIEEVCANLFHQYNVLLKELSIYDTSLAMKPKIIIINKIDACPVSTGRETHENLASALDVIIQHHSSTTAQDRQYPILCCSSHVGLGISELKNTLINFEAQEYGNISLNMSVNTP